MYLLHLMLGVFITLAGHGVDYSNARECSMDVTEVVPQTRYERASFRYTYSCGFLWLSRCSRTRYSSVSFQVYRLQIVGTQTECCDGYTMSENGTCIPVCSETCDSPRYCREPETCVCIDSRYTGPNCNTPVCSNCGPPRVCLAPETCQCLPGLTGLSCEDDINECDSPDRGGCEHTCVNTRGSHHCTCRQGFSIGTDERKCVGSVEISLASLNSSALVAGWSYPTWDGEGLTAAYNITCSDNTSTVSTSVVNGTSSGGGIEQIFDLSTATGYECCVTVLTVNGNGPPSCSSMPAVTIAATTIETTQSEATDSGGVNSPSNTDEASGVTGAQNNPRILDSSEFHVGIGVAGAGIILAVIVACLVLACCCMCHYRQKKEVLITSLASYRTDTDAEKDFHNDLYGMEYNSLKKKSIDEEDDGIKYNEAYNGVTDGNDYDTVREADYHYVRY